MSRPEANVVTHELTEGNKYSFIYLFFFMKLNLKQNKCDIDILLFGDDASFKEFVVRIVRTLYFVCLLLRLLPRKLELLERMASLIHKFGISW